MMKRVTWFASGMVAGAAGSVYAGRKLKRKVETLKPVNVAKSTVEVVRERTNDLAEAIREGRHAMREKETELRLRRDVGPRGLDTVEVVPVQPGQVIVLTQVAAARDARSTGRTRRRSS